MSRAAPATDEEITAAFERLLASGGDDGMPSDTGLDADTRAAIERCWTAPDSDMLVTAARHELAMQLDGTHLAEAEARQAALLNSP